MQTPLQSVSESEVTVRVRTCVKCDSNCPHGTSGPISNGSEQRVGAAAWGVVTRAAVAGFTDCAAADCTAVADDAPVAKGNEGFPKPLLG